MNDVYEVLAVKYADQTARLRVSNFIADDDHTAPHPIDFFVWIIRNNERTILVDTGFDHAEAARRGRTVIFDPPEALNRIGIAPSSIETVIVTHLHFDHAGGLADFAGARLHMQAAEMAFATGPCMCHDTLRHPFTADHVCEAVRQLYSGLVTFHEGDAEIAPGVTVHWIGGHSAGLQCVRVMTANGPVVLASDASHFYENFEAGKPFPIVVNVAEMLDGFQTLKRLAGRDGIVVPGHDPLVRERFPQLYSETGVDVRRLG